ncbi:pyridoxal phosphate-dependent aminotransferase family protein [Gramella sp. GC03-9]|uniref:Pyridoxal phosphate-dependent aminotransferase family protein n=1 Tax=Christiangramia oceanisediminis TaxID=2920386 RepID=A0A9X2I763_9FLAO|nr:pyridoxal phosphate-dependent aminotransferase family protein [Gramella oceanisediminis]MCP9198939.1 pyridoxal phosphate-dependent aminotransferase family protein [Gramella oceanisediminis]
MNDYFCSMRKLPLKLEKRLQKRKEENSFRELRSQNSGVDFFSNDYLGFSRSREIFESASKLVKEHFPLNGATGSRLLSGNYPLFKNLENQLASFHNAQSALVFNSGYDANIGFFSAVPQKDDFIVYDELSHASIRDGIQMSHARKFKFRHNDLEDLQKKLERIEFDENSEVYIVTESIFSMDGDSPNLEELIKISDNYNTRLVIDEAHATGVFGEKGEGLVQHMELEKKVFARIYTFGKAIGAHGAAILGSKLLKDYLVNYCRSFIYTTALPPHSVASIIAAYRSLENTQSELLNLRKNIDFFKAEIENHDMAQHFIESDSAIQVCLIKGNSMAKKVASGLEAGGFNVKAILSPTVPEGGERLRFCIHSYNSEEEISEAINILSKIILKH